MKPSFWKEKSLLFSYVEIENTLETKLLFFGISS